jgi:hypothetical protein
VQDSIKFGVDIPSNMKPWIEELIRTNQLVGENGELITDISEINFGEPMKTQFEKVIEKLQELIDKITAGINPALLNMQTNAGNAAGTIVDQFGEATTAAYDLAEAVRDVVEMRSPTGLEGIAHYAELARESLMRMADGAKPKIRSLVGDVADVASELDGVLERVGRFSGRTSLNVEREGEFAGYVDPNQLEFLSEQDAIARATSVFARYGVALTGDMIGRLGQSYGYGGSGRVERTRFESFLQSITRDLVEGRLTGLASGGLVLGPGRVLRFDSGGMVPRGTDTVPAMLTPGEMVLPTKAVTRLMRGDWPGGGGGITVNLGENSVNVSGVRSERELQDQLGRVMWDALKRRGARLNAA